MKAQVHSCRATGCQHVISIRMLMCMDHWRMVPLPMRREVLAAWRERRLQPLDPAAIARHQKAVAAAVAAVEEKQDRKARERAELSGTLFP